jgi:dihydroflavonol-4-reductase
VRVAVTGVTGMVGGQVARAAVEAGHDVVAVTRPGSPSRTERQGGVRVGAHVVPVETADLTDADGLVEALRGCDALVHCAAVYAFGAHRAHEVDSVNADGTRAVLEAAARAGVGRAVVTTSSVTCGSSTTPLSRTEADHLGAEPAPAYYASKVAQEEAALDVSRRHGLPVVLALPTVVLGGPYQRLAPQQRHRPALPPGPDAQHVSGRLQRRGRPRRRHRARGPPRARRPG